MDISVSEIKNLESEKYDPKIDDSVNHPTADDSTNSNTSLEIDAIQKHVEESLLFLDHKKAKDIDTENTDRNIDSEALTDPASEVESEIPKIDKKDENKLNFPNKHCENKESSDTLQPSVTPYKQNNKSETTKPLEQVINVTDIPVKINEDFENNDHSKLSQVVFRQEKVEEYPVSVQLEQNTTKVPEKMDEDVQLEPLQESSKLSHIALTKEKLEETRIPGEQDENVIEAPQNMDEDAQLESAQDSSVQGGPQKYIEESIMPVEAGETETGISETIEENKELSSLEKNSGEEINAQNNNVDAHPQEIVLESGIPKQAQAPVKINEYLAKHETIRESLPLDQNETGEVSETNVEPIESQSSLVQEHATSSENVEEIVNDPKNIRSSLEDVVGSPKLEETKVEIDEIIGDNVHFDSSDIVPIETAQETKDTDAMSEDEKTVDLEPQHPQETIDGGATTEDDKEGEVSRHGDENVTNMELSCVADNVNLKLSEIAPIETEKEKIYIENMSEPSQKPKDSVDGNPIKENGKEIIASGNKEGSIAKIEPTQAVFKHESVWECAVLSDTTQKDEKMDVDPNDIPSEQSEINIKQEILEAKIITELENKIEDPDIKNESLGNSDADGLETKENIAKSTLTEQGKHLKTEDNNIHKAPTQALAKPQNVWESRIIDKSRKETSMPVRKEKLVYNTNSAHQGALTAIPKFSQQLPKKKVDNVIYYEKSAHSGSLTVVPIQDTTKESKPQKTQKIPEKVIVLQQKTQKVPEKVIELHQKTQKVPEKVIESHQKTQKTPEKVVENLTYNTKSVHSASLRVVPIQDNVTECSPAKRARVEPTWSAVIEKTETAQSSATNEPATPVWSHSPSIDDREICSPAPSDVSAQWETAQEPASNRSQSSCSSILEDTPMDVDSDDGDLQPPGVHGDMDIVDLANWCVEHKICDESKRNNVDIKPLNDAAKFNTGVLKLGHIPKSLNQADVYQLIKKYTWEAGKEITKRIAFIYLDKVSSPFFNTAYVKWRDQEKYLTLQAAELLKRADLTLEDYRLIIRYDNRSKIDWDANNKPIVKNKPDKLKKEKSQNLVLKDRVSATRITIPSVAPFLTGGIDYQNTDTYGLNKEFLAQIGLTQPLTSDIIVKNVQKDIPYDKLHKIFGVAGIIRCLVLEPDEDCLNLRIEYDHPLEAVQAISIFHQQEVYGRTVSLTMNKSTEPNKPLVHEECGQLGPGLGTWGKPLKGVRVNVEVGKLRTDLDVEISKIKQNLSIANNKLKEALNYQMQINKNLKKRKLEQSTTEPFEQTPQNVSALQQNSQNPSQQNPQNVIATLSTVIASSIQNNLLSLLGVQPNLLQGLVPQNQNSVAPNWSAPNTDSLCWTPSSTQPNFSTNQTQPGQSYQQPDLANMQSAPNMQSVPNIQPVPNIQAVPAQNMQTAANIPISTNVQPSSGTMQYNPNVQMVSTQLSIQPSQGNELQGFTQLGYSNINSGTWNMQPGYTQPTNIQYSSNAQTVFSNQASSKTENPPLPAHPSPPMKPSQGNELQYASGYSNINSGTSNIQPGFKQPTNIQVQYSSNAQTVFGNQASLKSVNPPLPANSSPINTVYDSNASKVKSRFDIPPVVAKPQNRGPTQTYTPNLTQIKQVSPKPVKEFTLDIPLPVAKPQNRGPATTAVASSTVKTAPATKAPKSAGIKFNIPSLAAASSYGELDSIPPPIPKPQKRDKVASTSQATRQPAYDKKSPLPKAKSPAKELPWINKQIKAMRRSSKSPESSRSRSPRYDKLKDDRPSRDKEYSREREREMEREPERDYRRPATLVFRYLPASVSSDDLRDKMSEIGKLVSAQINGKGHAIVTFKYIRDAETCIEMYNKAKVDGQTIEVKWAK